MSKRKTVLKFAIPTLFLAGSVIAAGICLVYSAPIAIAIFLAIVALASIITLTVLAVSAIRSKSKSNEVDEKLRSESQDEERSLVQERDAPTRPLLPQVAEELTSPAQQQPPVDNLTEGIETPQHEEDTNIVINGEQGIPADTTEKSLPPYPEQTSPMNSFDPLQSFPKPLSIVVDGHNITEGNNQQTMVKVLYNSSEMSLPEYPLQSDYSSLPSLPMSAKLNAALVQHEQQRDTREGVILDSYNRNWMANHLDSFDSNSYLSSTMPNSRTRSFMEQSQGELSYNSLNNVHDIMDYRQNHPDESNLSLSIPGSMLAGSLNISFQRNHQRRVVRSNLSGQYNVDEKIYDSINHNSITEECNSQNDLADEGPNGYLGPYINSNGEAIVPMQEPYRIP